jgi:DNA-binding CsgD family transcriptional regulator
MYRRLLIILCLISLIGICPLTASDFNQNQQELSRYIVNNIPVDNQNWNICQNPKNGNLYFANSLGLGEFNGISFRLYPLPFRQGLRSVYITGDGVIFTGSFEEFGFWKENLYGELVYNSLSRNTEVAKNDEIWKIYDHDSIIYFQSFTTIYKYDYKSVTSVKAPFTMLFMFRAGNRFLVQILGNGLFWFNGQEFEFIEGSSVFSWIKVHSVIRKSDADLWICTSNNGIYRFNGTSFTRFESEISDFLAVHTCNSGLALSDSSFVFGTILNGIVYCNNDGKITRNYNFSNGLKNNTVLSLYTDIENGLWIGLDQGVNYINNSSPFRNYTNLSGTLGTIYSVLRYSDKLLLGTNHGLFETTITDSGEELVFSDLKIIPKSQGQVWTLERYDNQIICGHNDGTFLLENGSLRIISDITGNWSAKQYNDLLISGTYTGIVVFRKDPSGSWTFRNKIKGYAEPTRHLEVDYLGYIWASHPHKGIYRLEIEESVDSVVNIQAFGTDAEEDTGFDIYKINNQVVFTNSEAIFKYDYDEKKIILFTELNRTLGEYQAASQVIQFTGNLYWFINNDKIALFEISKDFEAIKQLELIQKMTRFPEREIQIIKLSESEVLIPATNSFIICNLSQLQKRGEGSRLKINKLLFQGKNKTIGVNASLAGQIRIPYRSNNLRVFFADPSHFDTENREYYYRLPEVDTSWFTTVQDNFSFLNVPPGRHKLEVKSGNTNESTEVFFTVNRPWYFSDYSIVMYLLMLAGLTILIVRIFRNELGKQKQMLEFEMINNRLTSELDFKSYELMLTMRYLIQKNEVLTELDQKIIALKSHSAKLPVKFINEMERIIKQGLESQTEEWKGAMNSLKLSQEGFFKRLMEKHPNLTSNDLRLCSYLKMNFSTKEIAKLLNISGRAVEISRYRLRKKMNLEHNVNLTEYLIREFYEN